MPPVPQTVPGKVLWLGPGASGVTDRMQQVLEEFLRRAKIAKTSVFFVSLTKKCGEALVKPKDKRATSFVLDKSKISKMEVALDTYIKAVNPKVIVVNDLAALQWIAANDRSLSMCRGSVYTYKGIPCLVVDSLGSIFNLGHGKWTLFNDLSKLARWMNGAQREEPKFTYTVCRSVEEVEHAVHSANRAMAIAPDIETVGEIITCIGYCALFTDGSITSFVVPFVDSNKPESCAWNSQADEIRVWELIRELHANPSIKIMQNGANYDAAFFIRYRIPLNNYLLDTLNLFHSVWTEAPKKLAFISSICLDFVRYWKDEAKGEKEERYPHDSVRQERYWRYCALDCYNTMLDAMVLVRLMNLPPMAWTQKNYAIEFGCDAGPTLAMSMTGFRVSQHRQTHFGKKLLNATETALARVRTMVDDPDFNPNSPAQFASLIYDVLGASPIKLKGKGAALANRSVDEKILKILMQQHPLFEIMVKAVWAVKKPKNNYSKYVGGLRLYNMRFMFNLSAPGTETGRLAGKRHAFKYGTNPQNVPPEMRAMVESDYGYIFFEPDFSQSDARFMAYESEDEKFIANLESDKDTHILHAAHFFKRTYEEIEAGYFAKEDWVVHSTEGVRQNSKRLGHGANFQMSEYTMYLTMGRPAVIGAGKALFAELRTGYIVRDSGPLAGQKKQLSYIHIPAIHGEPKFVQTAEPIPPHLWDQATLISLCKVLLEQYHVLYPRLRPFFKELAEQTKAGGNKIACAFGRTRLFFGDVIGDARVQRQLTAYMGQGGTAGNINRVMLWLFFSDEGRGWLMEGKVILYAQVHDSLVFGLREDCFHEIAQRILTIMEEPFTIRGRTLFIPAEGKIGYTWGEKNMTKYNKELTLEQLRENEEKVAARFAA